MRLQLIPSGEPTDKEFLASNSEHDAGAVCRTLGAGDFNECPFGPACPGDKSAYNRSGGSSPAATISRGTAYAAKKVDRTPQEYQCLETTNERKRVAKMDDRTDSGTQRSWRVRIFYRILRPSWGSDAALSLAIC
jgi:hypothetical protein